MGLHTIYNNNHKLLSANASLSQTFEYETNITHTVTDIQQYMKIHTNKMAH